MSQKQSNIIHATANNFEKEIVESNQPVIIDFWASWCGPCRAVAPILETLADKYQGKVKVAKLNVDEEPEIAGAFKVRSIPTIVAMDGREVIDVQVGAGGPQVLEKFFERVISKEKAA